MTISYDAGTNLITLDDSVGADDSWANAGDEIYLDKLQANITALQEQIDNIPEEKTEPDQETLDFWNENNLIGTKEMLEADLNTKKNFLEYLNNLGEV